MGELTTLKDEIAAWNARMQAQAKAREEETQRRHTARMASLPPGTCATCYGEQKVPHKYIPDGPLTERCPECDPPTPHAVGVPMEFQSARFANYRVEDGNRTAVAKAQAFIDGGGRDLYLVGGVGSGKTRLACTVANESYLLRRGGYFVRVPMVLHLLQPGRDEAATLERTLFTTPLLVMDDLGAERDQATDYTRRTLLMIYEERGDRGLRTILTSNKSVTEIAAMQDDDRLSSRLAGRADIVRLATSDQRLARRGKR